MGVAEAAVAMAAAGPAVEVCWVGSMAVEAREEVVARMVAMVVVDRLEVVEAVRAVAVHSVVRVAMPAATAVTMAPAVVTAAASAAVEMAAERAAMGDRSQSPRE